MKPANDKKYFFGHRERLREKFLEGKLANYELLELLLSYAILRIDVKPIVKRLLAKFGTVHKVLAASVSDLTEIVSRKTAIFIKAVYEMIILDYREDLKEQSILNDSKKLDNYCRMLLMDKKTEEFHILYLDDEYRLIKEEQHAIGTHDNVAITNGCQFFSEEDIRLTNEIKKIFHAVDIIVLDHFLVADNCVFSAKDMMLI